MGKSVLFVVFLIVSLASRLVRGQAAPPVADALVSTVLNGANYNVQQPFGSSTTISFKMLAIAVRAANLTNDLRTLAGSPAGVTVLGPTDSVIASLGEPLIQCLLTNGDMQALREVLLYHTIPEVLTADQISKRSSLNTALGVPLNVSIVSRGATSFNLQAGLLYPDVFVNSAGTLQGINGVLIPPTPRVTMLVARCNAAAPAQAPSGVAQPAGNPCKDNPCGSGGRCILLLGGTYDCACLPGFKAERFPTTCVPETSGDPYSSGF